MTKGIVFLTDMTKVDAKLVAVAVSNAAQTLHLAETIGLLVDERLEFTLQRGDEVLRYKLVEIDPTEKTQA